MKLRYDPKDALRLTSLRPTMRVLVACEFSGVVRDAFLEGGHEAYSADLVANAHPNHIRGDVTELLQGYPWDTSQQLTPWDLVIAHPPCTYLANSGVGRLLSKKTGRSNARYNAMLEACMFFLKCLKANALRVCVENPIMHGYASSIIKIPYSQIIQPYEHGHKESKATCLWLKNLPLLQPTQVVEKEGMRGRFNPWLNKSASKHPYGRGRIRSVFYEGVAAAMRKYWA